MARAPFCKWENGMKQAILLVSYGAASRAVWEKGIGCLEAEIRRTYPGAAICSAFTGRRMIEKWQEAGGEMRNETQALQQLASMGYERVAVLPTHLVQGKEYDRVRAAAEQCQDLFAKLTLGVPLLEMEEQREKVARALLAENEVAADEVLVLVGHGTEQSGNAVYKELEKELTALRNGPVLVGTLEEADALVGVAMAEGKARSAKIKLVPLLLTAGKHALKDITSEREESIAGRLRSCGLQVQTVEKGLGEYKAIRQIYREQLEELVQ